ncbi:hypothetical protein DAEQUDRAFT_766420 [Daedalea quercina L-15889]|uniref:Fungal-type protein kinase domain-containing protein n=1 Tax=Daedalea quercina L-15889 TaxID=1314783 RepID=A0A165PHR9_9APHY|nr:hypothetical protein DAEQUDRAFT_766420 [Daedalea quercina L-15889]
MPPVKAATADTPVRLEKEFVSPHRAETVWTSCAQDVRRGLPVADFVRAVWAFSPDMIPRPQGAARHYTLRYDLLRAYTYAEERASFTALAALMEDLLAQLAREKGYLRRVDARVVNARATRDRAMEGEGGTRPDLMWTVSPREGLTSWRTVWENCLAFVEIKKSPTRLWPTDDVAVDLEAFRDALPVALDAEPLTSPPAAHGSRKRKRVLDDAASRHDDGPHKRRRGLHATFNVAHRAGTLQEDEFHAALYITEMLSRHARSFASGLSVLKTTVTLWYGDRMGLVASEPFDFLKEPHKFLLAVAALGSASMHEFGFPPFFEGTKVIIPSGTARGLDGSLLSEDLAFDIQAALPTYRRYEAVGKGTMVIPVRATGNAQSKFGDGVLVAKRTWSRRTSPNEAHALRMILAALKAHTPRYLKHVADLWCYVEQTASEHDLPRALVPGLMENERCYRLMVSTRYEPLQNLRSAAEFRKVFVDTVRAHRWVAEVANFLHGDVSRNNLMFHREGKDVVGVLCDWDAAHARDRVDEAIYDLNPPDNVYETNTAWWVYSFGDTRCTGTPAFMDIERQTGIAPHRYEHDLESFFWVLIDFLKHFDPEDAVFYDDPLSGSWDHEDRAVWKLQFLLDDVIFWRIRACVHDDFLPLFDDWVPRLRTVFLRAFRMRTDHPSETMLRQRLEDATRAGDEAAQYDISKKLESKINARKGILSYQTFMHALRAALDIPN